MQRYRERGILALMLAGQCDLQRGMAWTEGHGRDGMAGGGYLSQWAITGHHRSSRVITGHHRSSWVIKGHQGSSRVIMGVARVIMGHHRSSQVIMGVAREACEGASEGVYEDLLGGRDDPREGGMETHGKGTVCE